LFSGGCCGSTKRVTIVGGWAWAWWLVTDVQRLSLEVMTLNPMCEGVETAQGVPLTVTGVAQCKIMKADELLCTASEQFLGKSVKEIKSTILQTLEGHLRAILGQYNNNLLFRNAIEYKKITNFDIKSNQWRVNVLFNIFISL
jgi:flotillin